MNIRSVPQRDRVFASLVVVGIAMTVSLALAVIDPDNPIFMFGANSPLTPEILSSEPSHDAGAAFTDYGRPSPRVFAILLHGFLLPLLLAHHIRPKRWTYTLAASVPSALLISTLAYLFIEQPGPGFHGEPWLSGPGWVGGVIFFGNLLVLIWLARYALPKLATHHALAGGELDENSTD